MDRHPPCDVRHHLAFFKCGDHEHDDAGIRDEQGHKRDPRISWGAPAGAAPHVDKAGQHGSGNGDRDRHGDRGARQLEAGHEKIPAAKANHDQQRAHQVQARASAGVTARQRIGSNVGPCPRT